MTGFRPDMEEEINSTFVPDSKAAPSSIDYRAKGYVTPVKNQVRVHIKAHRLVWFRQFLWNSGKYHKYSHHPIIFILGLLWFLLGL